MSPRTTAQLAFDDWVCTGSIIISNYLREHPSPEVVELMYSFGTSALTVRRTLNEHYAALDYAASKADPDS